MITKLALDLRTDDKLTAGQIAKTVGGGALGYIGAGLVAAPLLPLAAPGNLKLALPMTLGAQVAGATLLGRKFYKDYKKQNKLDVQATKKLLGKK